MPPQIIGSGYAAQLPDLMSTADRIVSMFQLRTALEFEWYPLSDIHRFPFEPGFRQGRGQGCRAGEQGRPGRCCPAQPSVDAMMLRLMLRLMVQWCRAQRLCRHMLNVVASVPILMDSHEVHAAPCCAALCCAMLLWGPGSSRRRLARA